MSRISKKYVINEASKFMKETYGYMYNIEVLTSVDNQNFYYCGIGRFAKTIEEATAWIENRLKDYEYIDTIS